LHTFALLPSFISCWRPSFFSLSFYRSQALQSTKQQLTWELGDPKREKILQKKQKQELTEDDVSAYLASDNEDGYGTDALTESVFCLSACLLSFWCRFNLSDICLPLSLVRKITMPLAAPRQ
jgi:hypothetical protein